MDAFVSWLGGVFSNEAIRNIAQAAGILLVGYLLSKILGRRIPTSRLLPKHRWLVQRVTTYLIYAISLIWALNILDVPWEFLAGTAGVLTVAAGFAAQTSASNLISGLFLMTERPFVIGDLIQVGETKGHVVSIDLLSVKLSTLDNLLVRIPNETMLKSNVTNLTHFPLRRFDLKIGVAYKEDLDQVKAVLLEIADKNPLCLEEPKPLVISLGFGESSIDFQFSAWAARENFLELRNRLTYEVKKAFDDRGIEIPFPHRTLYTGSKTEPLPVRVVDS